MGRATCATVTVGDQVWFVGRRCAHRIAVRETRSGTEEWHLCPRAMDTTGPWPVDRDGYPMDHVGVSRWATPLDVAVWDSHHALLEAVREATGRAWWQREPRDG